MYCAEIIVANQLSRREGLCRGRVIKMKGPAQWAGLTALLM